MAAQASLDPSFLWMVVAPSRCDPPVDAAPLWAAAPRLRRLQMLQRPGGIKHVREIKRGFLAKVVRRHYLY